MARICDGDTTEGSSPAAIRSCPLFIGVLGRSSLVVSTPASGGGPPGDDGPWEPPYSVLQVFDEDHPDKVLLLGVREGGRGVFCSMLA